MRRVYIASHGNFAKGLKDALVLLMGDLGINEWSCYHEEIPDNNALKGLIKREYHNLSSDDELVIFTDLLGGSVNKVASELMLQNDRIHVVAGMSMPLVLEFVLNADTNTSNAIENALESAKESMVYVNKQFNK